MRSLLSSLFFLASCFSILSCNEKVCEPTANHVLQDGVCVCKDGYSGQYCSVDDLCLTSEANPCLNGHCENNICNCHNFWTGEKCDVALLGQYEGTYKITVTGDNQNRFKLEDLRLNIIKTNSNQPNTQLGGNPVGRDIKLPAERLYAYEGYAQITYTAIPSPKFMSLGYWFDTHEERILRAEDLTFFNGNKIEFKGYGKIITHGHLRGGGKKESQLVENLTITLERISE